MLTRLLRAVPRAGIQSLGRYSTVADSNTPPQPLRTPEELAPISEKAKINIEQNERRRHSYYQTPPSDEDFGVSLAGIEEAYERIRMLYITVL